MGIYIPAAQQPQLRFVMQQPMVMQRPMVMQGAMLMPQPLVMQGGRAFASPPLANKMYALPPSQVVSRPPVYAPPLFLGTTIQLLRLDRLLTAPLRVPRLL